MRRLNRSASLAALALPLLLAGCSLLPTTRKLPVPKAPAVIQTVTPEELVTQLNQRWNAVHSLTATVEIQATELKTKEGVAKDWPSARGFILMRKPSMLRVVGQYFGVRIFDMVSNGKTFTLEIPSKNKAIEGENTITNKSSNPLENLRPGFFLDSLLIQGVEPDDFYSVAADTETVEDATKKHLLLTPEYVLSIMHREQGSQELKPVRVITFHRDDLLPYEQDVYGPEGNLETHITYSNYQRFDAGEYPARIVIKRPIEGIQVVLTVVQVRENMTLPNDQFQVPIPAGTNIQVLK
jgi:outer membrane lipoprotein-sorting protein